MYIVFYACVNIPWKKLIVFVTFIQLILNLMLVFTCLFRFFYKLR